MEGYLTTRQVAGILKIEIASVSRLIKRGDLKAEKLGPIWLIERTSVESYAQKNVGKSKFEPTRGKAG